MSGMAKGDKKPGAKPQPRPALPDKLQRSLDERRTTSAKRSTRPTSRTVPHRQGPSRQKRG